MTLVRAVEPEYVPVRPWIELLAPAAEIAKTIAPTEFVPRALRHNVPAVTAAILYGDEVGLGPLASVNLLYVIDGRVFMAAEAQRGLVLAAGHAIWPVEMTTTRCVWAGHRRENDEVTRVEWNMDQARRAHLDGKPNWRSYPRAMLSARASADLVRAIFADVVHGIGAIEEYDGDLGVGASAGSSPPSPTRSTRRRRGGVAAAVSDQPPVSAEARLAGTELPPLPGESDDASDAAAARLVTAGRDASADAELLTAGQLRRIQQLMRERGIGSRNERLALAREIIGREIGSSKDLTTAEADRVIVYLEHLDEPDDAAGARAVPNEPPLSGGLSGGLLPPLPGEHDDALDLLAGIDRERPR